MNEFIILSWLERVTNINSSSWVLFFGVCVAVANLLTKMIPADSTGWLGNVRKVTSIIGLYASTRVTSGTSQLDVAKTLVDHGIGTGEAKPVVRGAEGKFKKTGEEGNAIRGVVFLLPFAAMFWIAVLMSLPGCVGMTIPTRATKMVCDHQDTIRTVLNYCPIWESRQ